MTASRELLDTLLRVDSPEGGSLPLRPAGPLLRTCAFLIDLLLRVLLAALVLAVVRQFGELGGGLALLLLFLLTWWYMVLFEVLWLGRTPGKYLCGLRVLQTNGSPPDWGCSLLRNLLRLIDLLPVAYTLGLVCSLSNRRFQRVGDLVAGTLVVHDRLPRWQPASPRPPHLPLTPLQADEQRALLAFSERAGRLSAERREELAGLLAAALGVEQAQATDRLLAIAAELRGQP